MPQLFFHHRDEAREKERHHEIDERDDRVALEISEGGRRVFAAAAQKIGYGQDGDERRVLKKSNEFIPDGRQNDPDRLRDYDPPHGGSPGHAEGESRFHLPLRYGLDSGAEDFGHVSAIADRHGEYGRRRTLQSQKGAEGVVDVEKLDEKGYAADYFDVNGRNAVDRLVRGNASEAREEPYKEGKGYRDEGDGKGGDKAVGNEGKYAKVGVGTDQGQGDEKSHGAEKRNVPGGKQSTLVLRRDEGTIGDVDRRPDAVLVLAAGRRRTLRHAI